MTNDTKNPRVGVGGAAPAAVPMGNPGFSFERPPASPQGQDAVVNEPDPLRHWGGANIKDKVRTR